MKNRWFSVEPAPENGGLKSLVLNDDPASMNWIEGVGTWGVPLDFRFLGMEEQGNSLLSRYQLDTLELEVTRTMEEGLLRERFTFRNTGTFDLYFQRGGISLYTTFNDSYESAEICIAERCHTHLWCGGENSYVHATKMSPFPIELALILTEGALDAYSVRRIEEKSISNDRGDFLLHPEPFHLLPGETTSLEWIVTAFPRGGFRKALLDHGGAVISFRQETVFLGEAFHIEIEQKNLPGEFSAFCNGIPLESTVENGKIRIEHVPDTLGEHRFDFVSGNRRFHAFGFCSEPFEQLLEKRIAFLLKHQQVTDPTSPLYGAFLIYDNEEHARYFSYRNRDCNANRERTNMSLLLCRYLRTHRNPAAERALDLAEQFFLREIYDTATGAVFDNIGRSTETKRLYNNAGMINFWLELYDLRKQEKYLDWIERSIRFFYENGGWHFYPNGTLFSDCVSRIRAAGRTGTADELQALVRRHVREICATGYRFPPHEVNFEQTIATPAVAIPAAWCALIDNDPEILAETKRLVELLDLFQGDQPDYRLHEIAIRHWDEFWFGKRKLYGDTFPHYLSVLSARAFLLYAACSGDRRYAEKAKRCMRNNLCLFSPDGSASCARLHPFSVTMLNPDGSVKSGPHRGEFYDPWANDQDGALYLILAAGGGTEFPL